MYYHREDPRFSLTFFKLSHKQTLFYLQANWNKSSKSYEPYHSSEHGFNSGLIYS